MSYARPTLAELIARIQTDFNTRLPGGDSRLRRGFIYVLARVIAGVSHGLYGFIQWVFKQVFPDTADGENLERWANIWQKTRKAADKATGIATITGVEGSAIQSGTLLRTASEVEYITTAAASIPVAGTVNVAIEAVIAGDDGNIDSGTQLFFVEPIDGVQSTATSGAVTGGADTESDASLLARLLDRLRQPPMGGSENDYKQWARDVAGVTRAWVYPQLIADNSVTVRFMTDNLTADGIPTAQLVQDVEDYISAPNRLPVTVDLYVVAPTASVLDFDITLKNAAGLDETDPDIRAAVQSELEDLIFRDASPGGTLLISRIREAISIAAGEYDHVLNSPSADVTHSAGEIATMGTITWTGV